MKKLIYFIILLNLSLPVMAQTSDITLSGADKYKPQNVKLLKRLWSKSLKTGSPSKSYFPENSNPVVEDGKVYIGTHGGVFYALEEVSGKILWKFENEEPISSMANISGDYVYYTDLGGWIVCLNKTNGELNWKQYLGEEMLGQPLLTQNKVYILKGEQEVVSLAQADGKILWNKVIKTYIRDITMRGHSSIIHDGESLFVGLADGHLYKLNSQNGTILWNKDLSTPLRTFKDIDAHVVVDGDSLYIGGYFGAMYRLNKSSGSIIWKNDVATGVTVLVLPEVVIASNTDGSLVGMNKSDGKQIWFNNLNGTVLSAPVIYNGKVFVSTFKKDAYLINPENGTQVQKIDVSNGALTKPAVDGNHIYILTNSGSLVAFGPNES